MPDPNQRIYCRSCNREIVVDEEMTHYYVEHIKGGGNSYHIKQDCDVV